LKVACGHGPQRTCIGCRKVLDQAMLVRYVLSPHGQVLVDYGRKLPGRGVYTCIDKNCVEEAVKRRQFDRAFKGRNEKPSKELLLGSLAEQIKKRVLNLLGMARKSAVAISGSRAVSAELAGQKVPGLVLLGEDLSPAIAVKISGAAKARKVPHFTLFDKDVLGQVLGKGQRSVVAVLECPLADSIKSEIFRYMHIAGEADG
jgi:predicted RNA-binding protein YlxR (DUF448 family)